MDKKYVTVKETESCLAGIEEFAKISGLSSVPTMRSVCYVAAVTASALLIMLQVLYATSYYWGDIGSIALIVYHALSYSCITGNIMVATVKSEINYLLAGSCRSYDYGGKVIQKVHLDIIRGRKNKYFAKISNLRQLILFIIMANFFLNSIVEKYLFGKQYLELCPIWYPDFLNRDIFLVQLATFLHQLVVMTFSIVIILAAFGLGFSAYNHITSELILLSRALGLVREMAKEMAEDEGIELTQAYKHVVRMCSQHHTFIIQFFITIQPVMRILHTISYFVGLLLLACTAFVFQSDNIILKIKFSVISVVQLSYLFSVSWCAEEISDKGRMANSAVYDVPWLSLPQECRTSLQILLLGSQRPLSMYTFSGQATNLDGFMTLLKASYSFFNMMRATSGEN